MNGYVSNIQRFSTQDGPGLRTTVFLKGCPLRCPWCHNRETWLPAPSLLYYAKECVLCGACAAACTKGVHEFIGSQHLMRREKCAACGNCARECPTGALELRGETCTPEELLDLVCRDRPFYEQSGGGVTFSGGEPLMQFDFVKQCLHLLRDEGVHICLDTSGWGGHAAELAPLVDLFLWDIKHTDAEKHRALTGVELAPILQSLRKTDERGAKIRIRCPIIPEVNATEEHLRAIGKIAQPLKHLEGIDLVPYHPLGMSKSAALGVDASEYRLLTAEEKAFLLSVLQGGVKVPVQWL